MKGKKGKKKVWKQNSPCDGRYVIFQNKKSKGNAVLRDQSCGFVMCHRFDIVSREVKFDQVVFLRASFKSKTHSIQIGKKWREDRNNRKLQLWKHSTIVYLLKLNLICFILLGFLVISGGFLSITQRTFYFST